MSNKKCQGCKGCIAYRTGCLIRYNSILTAKCPCRSCLVKMICVTTCEERKNIFGTLIDYLIRMDDINEGTCEPHE